MEATVSKLSKIERYRSLRKRRSKPESSFGVRRIRSQSTISCPILRQSAGRSILQNGQIVWCFEHGTSSNFLGLFLLDQTKWSESVIWIFWTLKRPRILSVTATISNSWIFGAFVRRVLIFWPFFLDHYKERVCLDYCPSNEETRSGKKVLSPQCHSNEQVLFDSLGNSKVQLCKNVDDMLFSMLFDEKDAIVVIFEDLEYEFVFHDLILGELLNYSHERISTHVNRIWLKRANSKYKIEGYLVLMIFRIILDDKDVIIGIPKGPMY